MVNFKEWMWNKYSQDGGKMLVQLGALGWLLSSVAQIVGLAVNKEISNEDKKFLFPQEIADGVVNCVLFYFLTSKANDWSKLLADKGLIVTNNAKEALEKIAQSDGKRDIKTLLKENKNVITLLETYSKREFLGDENKLISKALDEMKKLRGGLGILGATVASVVACNILTPVIRNALAAYFSKNYVKREEKKLQQIGAVQTTQIKSSQVFKGKDNMHKYIKDKSNKNNIYQTTSFGMYI